MPVYAYVCRDCSEDFKAFHSVSDTQFCIKCNSYNLQKKFNGTIAVSTIGTRSDPKDRVEKFIEESREALRHQLEEARKEIK